VTHYEILRNDPSILAVKVNLAAYEARPIFKSRNGVGIVFNTNFFNRESPKKEPIGVFRFQGEEMGSIALSKGKRPTFFVGDIECEGAPMLVKDSEIVWRQSAKECIVRSDVLAKTQHLCLGALKGSGKTVIVYFSNHAIWECARVMQDLGCTDAINYDGGSSASLSIQIGDKRIVKGNPFVTCGIQLSREE
jgi:hypothetical protein